MHPREGRRQKEEYGTERLGETKRVDREGRKDSKMRTNKEPGSFGDDAPQKEREGKGEKTDTKATKRREENARKSKNALRRQWEEKRSRIELDIKKDRKSTRLNSSHR